MTGGYVLINVDTKQRIIESDTNSGCATSPDGITWTITDLFSVMGNASFAAGAICWKTGSQFAVVGDYGSSAPLCGTSN